MKAKIRVATDMYEFIEAEVDGEPADIFGSYRELKKLCLPASGLPERDFNHFIDNMLLGEQNTMADYEQMSERQKEHVQIVKKGIKRIKSKQE